MKTGDRQAQRVLIVMAAMLLALFALVSRRSAVQPVEAIADDPRLEVRIDLNTASAADLETLPGIGQSLAARIVAHRAEHGPFRFVEELQHVSGVGARLAETLRPLVAVR